MDMQQLSRDFKDSLYRQFARIGKSMSSEKRLEILHLLSQGPKAVERLASSTNSSIANVSKHLQVLSESRLVKYHKQGNYVFYELANPQVAEFLLSLWNIGEVQLTDVQRIKEEYQQNFSAIQTLTMDELVSKMNSSEVVLLDVRPKDEFQTAHIPGALSIPIDELEAQIAALPKDREIVAYCRGPYCIYATQAVQFLQEYGYQAFRIEEGVLEWEQYSGGGES
ncbi:metalloregulator ArsR/SmtB family transcription factor [Paenibacillus sp. NPDC058174]|uniref:metalloregulator ArsR/SmtB family transcription factor n=1 Tax=Paenibacillus sp. NPDC058174 TaxID=3346366 RepID=UPI0036DB0EFC